VRVAVAIGLATLLLGAAPAVHRLPKGYHWGRCLLVYDGKTRISGRCAYEIRKDGEFYIAGPRQIYEGIDFQNPQGYGAMDQSRDYWGRVYRDSDGTWTGYGNDTVDGTHGSHWGTLTRKGACLVGHVDLFDGQTREPIVGPAVKVCLWRE
jgi:hypothetical protein